MCTSLQHAYMCITVIHTIPAVQLAVTITYSTLQTTTHRLKCVQFGSEGVDPLPSRDGLATLVHMLLRATDEEWYSPIKPFWHRWIGVNTVCCIGRSLGWYLPFGNVILFTVLLGDLPTRYCFVHTQLMYTYVCITNVYKFTTYVHTCYSYMYNTSSTIGCNNNILNSTNDDSQTEMCSIWFRRGQPSA